jgi:hypothetical protein
MADLSLVLVTPERTLFDKPVASIRVPLLTGPLVFTLGELPWSVVWVWANCD